MTSKAATGAVSAFEVMNRLSVEVTVKNVPSVRDPLGGAGAIAVLIEFEAAHAGGLRHAIETALAAALDAGEAETALIAENTSQARDFWALREMISTGHKPEGAQVSHDISVPVSATPDFLTRANAVMEKRCPGVRIVAFGHMGDGNFHYTAMQPAGMAPDQFPGAELSHARVAGVTVYLERQLWAGKAEGTGGAELAEKMFALGLWPNLSPQLLPFVNAVRTAVGLAAVQTVN